MARILCAMSGGVDSSVAAALLQREGHDVLGVFLRLGAGSESDDASARPGAPATNSCCSVSDAHDAARVADRLGVPFYPLNYAREFDRIIDYFVSEYNNGRTPNPCARCNQWIKFGTLLQQAIALGCEFVATGHYARRDDGPDGPRLLRGRDERKDQSYFLFTMTRVGLARTVFPVGHLSKSECRAIARSLDLPVADKPDSQEICFVPGGDYRAVVASRTPSRICPGEFLDEDGEVIGEHPGHQHFTIGQRRGLNQSFGEPRYVVAIDPERNTVTIGPRDALACIGLTAREVSWLSIAPPPAGAELDCRARIRHHGRAIPCHVELSPADKVIVRFSEPEDAVTPGQAVVFYAGDVVLGGGWIESALRRGSNAPHDARRVLNNR